MNDNTPTTLDMREGYEQDVRVCANLFEVFKSDTCRFVFIQALRELGRPNDDILRFLTTLRKTWGHGTEDEVINDAHLMELRTLLKDEKFVDTTQKIFDGLEFSGMNKIARDRFKTLFNRGGFGNNENVAQQLAFSVVGKVYESLTLEQLKGVSDDEVALEDMSSGEVLNYGERFLARKYGIVRWEKHIGSRSTAEGDRRRFFEGIGVTSEGQRIVFDESGVSYPKE